MIYPTTFLKANYARTITIDFPLVDGGYVLLAHPARVNFPAMTDLVQVNMGQSDLSAFTAIAI